MITIYSKVFMLISKVYDYIRLSLSIIDSSISDRRNTSKVSRFVFRYFFGYRRVESLGSVYYNRPVQNTD